MSEPRRVKVPRDEIRSKFNTGGYREKALAGHLRQRVTYEKHPAPPASNEPHCTKSQMVEYYDGDSKVAVVHQYRRTDGTIGGSGTPDPKMLLEGGIVYFTE